MAGKLTCHGSWAAEPVLADSGADIPVSASDWYDGCSVFREELAAACAEMRIPIAAQFMDDGLIALFAFEVQDALIRISVEHHYRLVPAEELTAADLQAYRLRLQD